MDIINAKKYYRIEFEVLSPLSVGNGINGETDSDIMVDSKGYPYISGTSLAGVFRRVLGKKEAELYFGKLLMVNNELDESAVVTYDAVLCEMDRSSGNLYIGKRDMVALDEYKVATDGAKFDFQILEPGVKMVTFIEVNLTDGKLAEKAIDQILAVWQKNGISFGSKTKRGYGLTKATEIKTADFNFMDVASKEKWIDFDLYEKNDLNWKPYESKLECVSLNYAEIKLKLRLLGGLSIREYSTKVGEADYEQMKLRNSMKDSCMPTAVIPGTSWAGAFRGQMRKLGMNENELQFVFGNVKREKKEKNGKKEVVGHQSYIAFSESYIKDGVDVIYSRNAIDRFSGGTVKGALFTESTRYNGTTELVIRVDQCCINSRCDVNSIDISSYLAATIMDLHAGYMAVGGLTSVGRGLFEVSECTINGKETEIDYAAIQKKLQEVSA